MSILNITPTGNQKPSAPKCLLITLYRPMRHFKHSVPADYEALVEPYEDLAEHHIKLVTPW